MIYAFIILAFTLVGLVVGLTTAPPARVFGYILFAVGLVAFVWSGVSSHWWR